jgi:nitrogen regulatory protein PII
MKEIKAYVRQGWVENIVGRLEEEGARDLTITHAEAVGPMAEVDNYRVRIFRRHLEKYSDLAKIEVVCADAEVDRFLRVLQESACTGEHSEGRIFILNVERAVNLRTGEEGENAL